MTTKLCDIRIILTVVIFVFFIHTNNISEKTKPNFFQLSYVDEKGNSSATGL